MSIDLEKVLYSEEKFQTWWTQVQPYGIFLSDKTAYAFYRAKLITAWDIMLRALNMSFEYNQEKLLEACSVHPLYKKIITEYAFSYKVILTLPPDFYILRSKFYDKKEKCSLSSILNEMDVSSLLSKDEPLTLKDVKEQDFFSEALYNFVKLYYPLMDLEKKREIVLSLAYFITRRNLEGKTPEARIQGAVVSCVSWWVLHLIYKGSQGISDVLEQDFLKTFREILDNEEDLERDLQMAQTIYKIFISEKNLPLLSTLQQENLHSRNYNSFKSSLKETTLKDFAELI